MLPLSWNAGGDPISGVMKRAEKFIDVGFWTDYALPGAVGFAVTKVGGGLIREGLAKVFTAPTGTLGTVFRFGTDALSASVLSWLVGRFIGKKYEERVFFGGVVAIAHGVLKEVAGGTTIGRYMGLDGLGDDLSSQMKDAVAKRLEAELSGGVGNTGAFLTEREMVPQASIAGDSGVNGGMVGAFVTETALRMQPGYAPTSDLRDHDPTNSETTL